MKVVLLILFSVAYLIYTIRAQRLLLKSKILSGRHKLINSILIWLIPFLWFNVIKGQIVQQSVVVTKEVRDKRRKDNENPFYDGGFSA